MAKIAIGETRFFWLASSGPEIIAAEESCKINWQIFSANIWMAIISRLRRRARTTGTKFGHVVNDANGDGWRKWSRAEGWRQVKVLSSPSLRPLSVSALINRNWRPREASHIARSMPHASSSSQLHNRARRFLPSPAEICQRNFEIRACHVSRQVESRKSLIHCN